MQKSITIIFLLFIQFAIAQHKPAVSTKSNAKFKDMLGVNAFEWDFLQNPNDPNETSKIYEPKMNIIKSFSGIRHYLDWQKVEPKKGSFTFNPTTNGGWNLDIIYQRCKEENIDMLACIKGSPEWLQQSYPDNMRDGELVPMPYGANKKIPASYIEQAKMGFQFAARYGGNKNVDPAMVTVDSKPRWTNDPVNIPKIGMGVIKYMECDNERDKWWKGDKAKQTAEEYAANLSAFYDGDKGKLGKGVGVKAADPNMKVVMAGLANADPNYVQGIINWCKVHRGYKPDGSVNLCFDVINFHLYSNNHKPNSNEMGTVGIAPELSEAGRVADAFVKLGKAYHLPVWVTECGYDLNPGSPQRAIVIGNKSALLTQADWTIRTSLLYARHGIDKVFFYELYDDNLKNPTQYASSGLAANVKLRPSGRYISQAKNLLGNYAYKGTINSNPIVDVYRNGSKTIYVLMMPTQTGENTTCKLSLDVSNAIQYNFSPDSDNMIKTPVPVTGHILKVKVSETPVFVEVAN